MDKGLIIRILGYALIPIAVSWVMSFAMKETEKEEIGNQKKERVIVHLPKAFCWVAIIEMLFFTAVIILLRLFPHGTGSVKFTGGDSPVVLLVFSLFVLLGAYLLYISVIWRVEVFKNEDFFILRDYWGRRHKIYYSDCTSYQYRYHNQEIIVRNHVKNFTVGYFLVNNQALITALNQHHVKREKDR